MKKKIKILYIITKSFWGGAQRYVYDLAVNLPKDKFEVICAVGGEGLLLQKLNKADIHTIKIAHLQKNVNIKKEAASLKEMLSIIKNHRPDVLHLNSSKAGGLGALCGRISRIFYGYPKKIIFTVHGWAFFEKRNFIYKTVIYLLSWFTALLVDDIIVINSIDEKAAQKMPLLRKAKVHNIALGIEYRQDLFLSPAESKSFIEKTIKAHINSPIIGCIAELTPNKGIDILIDALFILKQKNIRFSAVIIGEGEQKKELAEKISKLQLADRVFLTGFIANAARLITAFDVFVLPSRKEGLPYTIIETMAAKVPIVASKVGGVPDLIENKKEGILLEANNAELLAEAVHQLIQNKSAQRKYFQNAYEKCKKNFTLNSMIVKTILLYTNTNNEH